MSISEPKVEIVLCIPGPWTDRSQLVERIAKDSGGYVFAGAILLNIETNDSFELEYEGHDPRMYDAFNAAGPHWKDTPEMDRISSHKSVVYLVSKGGSIEAAHSIMAAANGLLKAGGFAVKVESTGLAHPPIDWNEQCKYNYLFKSHSSYVVYITSEQVYSCGMHNFGLRDAIVENSKSDDPVELLRAFTHYLLSESPKIEIGQTFSVDADAPIYRILDHPGINYGESSLFNNPYGAFLLKAVDVHETEDDLVFLFKPSLIDTFAKHESLKGAPLTEEEALSIRDGCQVEVVKSEVYKQVSQDRGYDDIDPENCWAEWQAYKKRNH